MDDHNPIAGWNAIEEGAIELPVRSESQKSESYRKVNIAIGGPGNDITKTPEHPMMPVYRPQNLLLMRLSALTGIAIVVVIAALYFGMISVRGDLLGGTETVTIRITKEGHFSPENVTIQKGSSFEIVNENDNPQVLKPKDGRDLFPVQVLFKDPYNSSVPTEASGTYQYISETLPESEILTITVTDTEKREEEKKEETPSKITVGSSEIPLPFGSDTPLVQKEPALRKEPILVQEEKSITEVRVATEHSSESAIVSLGRSEKEESVVTFDTTKIPTNPYTVEEGKKKNGQKADRAAAKDKEEKLHAGAPLKALQKHKPMRTSETGPAGVTIVLGISFVLFFALYRKRNERMGL